MKENHLSAAADNPSKWGKWLLAAGLLLVAVQGFFQLYEVQAFFFPGKYYEVKLNSINQECSKIETGLKALQDEINILTGPSRTLGQPNPGLQLSTGSLASPSAHVEPRLSAPAWKNTLQAAKQKRVKLARNLNYTDTILLSMQKSLESDNGELSTRSPGAEKNLSKIHELLDRCRIYKSYLINLTDNLNKLETYFETQRLSK